jgi:hypothetical protein
MARSNNNHKEEEQARLPLRRNQQQHQLRPRPRRPLLLQRQAYHLLPLRRQRRLLQLPRNRWCARSLISSMTTTDHRTICAAGSTLFALFLLAFCADCFLLGFFHAIVSEVFKKKMFGTLYATEKKARMPQQREGFSRDPEQRKRLCD